MPYDCWCDYDPPEFCTVALVKHARKEHRCDECSRLIRTGEPYEKTFGKWDGYTMAFEVCEQCLDLRKWAIESVPCFCWTYGNLHEDVREMVREIAPEMPGFFFEYGRRMVAIRRARRSPPP